MTRPLYDGRISLGNILTVTALIIAAAAAWFTVSITTEFQTKQLADLETRMRKVEASQQSSAASFAGMGQVLGRIEHQQDINNALIRELLSRIGPK